MEIVDVVAFGKLAKAARTKKGLKIGEFAALIGESEAWAIKMEIGFSEDGDLAGSQIQSDREIVEKMQEIFEVNPSYFAAALNIQGT